MRRRKLRFVASTLTTLGLVLALMAGVVGSAAAATCVTSSNPPADAPDAWSVQDSVWYCHYLPNGHLCLRYINNFTGVDIHYDKTAGSKITAYFSYVDLITGVPHCGGPFTENVGETKSFAWNNTFPSGAVIGWMNVDGQAAFGTAVLHRYAKP